MFSSLEQIVEAYPTAPYDWLALSMNPAISFQFIAEHRSLPWVIRAVSRNPSITEDIVRSNITFPWSFADLCSNPNISFEFIRTHAIAPTAQIHIDWRALSRHPMIDMETVDRYPSFPWKDRSLSLNPNVTSNYILNEGGKRDWHMPSISANPGITERDIYKNVLPWVHLNLSSNPHLPSQYVADNLSAGWNLHAVSTNISTDPVDVDTLHAIPWDYSGLSINTNITMPYVLLHQDKPWSKPLLLSNQSITLADIESNRDYFDLPNAETYMCSNPTITVEWVKKNERVAHWNRLSRNHFGHDQYASNSIDL